jgi:hypothetical protein
MKTSSDPSVHRQREQQLVAHIERLLGDSRFRLDTIAGARAVTSMLQTVNKSDKGTDVKRQMTELNKPDRALQEQMPIGEVLEVTLSQKAMLIFRKTVGRLRVVCVSPTRTLIRGGDPTPMTSAEVNKILGEQPPPLGGAPTTIVLLSTSGFTIDAHEVTDRRADRTVVLVEPNDAGGWSVWGPPEKKALVDLLDPEADTEKRQRLEQYVNDQKAEMLTSGVASDRIAAKLQLPRQWVESELKNFAKESAGLVAKRLDGRVVLFREGSATPAASTGGAMPLVDKIRSIFSLKGATEKKIAFLSERRTALSQQRDRSYEEIGTLEKKDAELTTQFKDTTSPVTRRRITSQLVQLRKDIERRQQLITVLNQQVNVVSTHLHNLELTQQGKQAKLPDSEEIASDAAAAEEMLAQLQADNEVADSVGGIAHAGMTDEERALYEELEREAGGPETTGVKLDNVESPEEEETPSSSTSTARTEPRRTEPEAG